MWNLFTWICDYDSRWHPLTTASDLFSMHSFAIFSYVGLAVVGVSVSLGNLSQNLNINFVHYLYCSTFVILCYSESYSFLYRFLFSGEKKLRTWWKSYFLSSGVDCSKYYIYIYLVLVLTEYNDEISLWALLMLPVKRVPHILLLLPFITKYYMIPVSLSSLKPGITKDIFVQFMSCRFKSPSSCEFHVFSWLHLWSI